MGASESSARSNGTTEEEEEEERQHENNSSVGSSMAVAATVAAGAAVAVWGISKMLSNNKKTEEISNRHVTKSSLLSTDRIINEARSPRSTWSPPPPGRYKMNTDGSCRPTPTGLTGYYGGILRDHNGKWVHGFIGSIGVAEIFKSELHGIVKGLELLDRLNYKGAILEADNASVCHFVTGDPEDDYHGKSEVVHACWPDIKKCRQLRFKNRITVEYVRGKGSNRCADKLADMARKRGEAYLELEIGDLSPKIMELIEKDKETCSR